MKRLRRITCLVAFTGGISCGTDMPNKTMRAGQTQSDFDSRTTIEVTRIDGKDYIALEDILSAGNLNSTWNAEDDSLVIGRGDASSELKSGEWLEENGKRYLSRERAKSLLVAEGITHRFENDALMLIPAPIGPSDSLPFGEDNTLSLAAINTDSLINEAKKYIGTPYQFGAKPYAESGRFDCSSFAKHINGKFGVTLPRSSRDQATVGTLVSKSSLQKGDLLFFHVPSRSTDSNYIGHVSIYIGNNQVIDALPNKGVQIHSIDTSYWRDNYRHARRHATSSGGGDTTSPGKANIYRFYNGKDHFLTKNYSEGINAGYSYEGVAFQVFTAKATGRKAFFRCYNKSTGDHFVSTWQDCEDKTSEGLLGYVYSSKGNGKAVSRCFNGTNHLSTTNPQECTQFGYKIERIQGYAP